MGVARLMMRALCLCPPLSRTLLRQYLRAGGPMSSRAEWAVEELKARLLPRQTEVQLPVGAGLVLALDLRGVGDRHIYYHGVGEREVSDFLKRTLRPGMTFIDAGANLGEYTLLAARLVGPAGRVYALECAPRTLVNLHRNVTLNHLTHVRVVEAAVCDA